MSVENSGEKNTGKQESLANGVEIFGEQVLSPDDLKEVGKSLQTDLQEALKQKSMLVQGDDPFVGPENKTGYNEQGFVRIAEKIAALKTMRIVIKNPPAAFQAGLKRGMRILQARPESLARYAAVMQRTGMLEVDNKTRTIIVEEIKRQMKDPKTDPTKLAALCVNAKIIGIPFQGKSGQIIAEKLKKLLQQKEVPDAVKLMAQIKYLSEKGENFKPEPDAQEKADEYLAQTTSAPQFVETKRYYNQVWPQAAQVGRPVNELVGHVKETRTQKNGLWQTVLYAAKLKEIERQSQQTKAAAVPASAPTPLVKPETSLEQEFMNKTAPQIKKEINEYSTEVLLRLLNKIVTATKNPGTVSSEIRYETVSKAVYEKLFDLFTQSEQIVESRQGISGNAEFKKRIAEISEELKEKLKESQTDQTEKMELSSADIKLLWKNRILLEELLTRDDWN